MRLNHRDELRGCSLASIPRDMVNIPQQVFLVLRIIADVIEQECRGSGRRNTGGHVGQVATIAPCQNQGFQVRPGLGCLQLVAEGHPNDVDQMGIVPRGSLPGSQERPDIVWGRVSTECFGSRSAHEWILIRQFIDGELVLRW